MSIHHATLLTAALLVAAVPARADRLLNNNDIINALGFTPSSQSNLMTEIARAHAAEARKVDTFNGSAAGLALTNPTSNGGTFTGATLAAPTIAGAAVNAPLIWLNPAPALNATYASGGLSNGVIIAAGGNRISYCPLLSCVTSPSTDHQRASALFWATTSDDGHSEEQTVAIETVIGTGHAKPWAPSSAYAVGDNVSFGGAANAVYRVIRGGISAPSGTGPTGTGAAIADGSVIWTWINGAAIDGKIGLYNETVVRPGAGNSWSQVNNLEIQPGSIPAFDATTEMDFSNNSGTDCVAGIAACNALQIFMGGTNSATAAIAIAPNGVIATERNPALFGVFMNGNLAKSADLEDDGAGSQYGVSFGAFVPSSHTVATIFDRSTGVNGILMAGAKTSSDIASMSTSPAAFVNTGTHANAAILENSASPIGISLAGSHSHEAIGDTSTTPVALNLSGTYSLAAITTAGAAPGTVVLNMTDGQKICWAGTNAPNCMTHSGGKFYLSDSTGNLMSVANGSGNAVFKGTVTASGTP